MKFAKIAVLFVAMTFVAGQAMAGDRRATFDQLAKGIKSVTDVNPYLVISKSDIISDVEDYFGNRRVAERFEQILQYSEDPKAKNLINDVLYLVYGKLSGETISKIGRSAATKFNIIVKNWKGINETCIAEGCSQDVFDLINLADNWKPGDTSLSGPDNWHGDASIVNPDGWKPGEASSVDPGGWKPTDGDPTPAPHRK